MKRSFGELTSNNMTSTVNGLDSLALNRFSRQNGKFYFDEWLFGY